MLFQIHYVCLPGQCEGDDVTQKVSSHTFQCECLDHEILFTLVASGPDTVLIDICILVIKKYCMF